MKAQTSNLMDFILNLSKVEIPVYQRCYCWGFRQLNQLWEDIESLTRNNGVSSHFFGTVVHKPKEFNQHCSLKTSYLIDGQQRLTTIAILMSALSDVFGSQNLKHNFVYLRFDNEFYPKITLSNEDKESFNLILNNEQEEENQSPIINAYRFFVDAIKASALSEKQILLAIDKFEIIEISLEEKDNPQLIFDSLNSTGVKLDATEQIKNYLLMGLNSQEQNEIYFDCWKPMESSFNVKESSELFEAFIRDYLTIQNNGKVPNICELYQAFNAFYNYKRRYQSPKEIVENIYNYSRHFNRLRENNFKGEIKNHIKRINALEAYEAYPFLMEVVDDYANKLINEEILCEILKTVETFILNYIKNDEQEADFATLSKNISKILVLKDFMPKVIDEAPKKPVRLRDLA